jgi:hypothetical protein
MRSIHEVLLPLLACALLATPSSALVRREYAPEYGRNDRLALLTVPWNADDVALGLAYRHPIATEIGLGLSGGAEVRPYEKAVAYYVRPHFRMQFREIRYLFSLNLDEVLALHPNFGLYGNAGFGYTAADYQGTGRSPEEGWTPVIGAGFYVRVPAAHPLGLRVGYRYADLRTADTGWFSAAFFVGLGR